MIVRKEVAKISVRYQGLLGNTAYKDHTNRLWNSWARDLGFKDKREALECLYKEWSMEAIAELFGVAESTIFYQLKKLNIKTRKRQFSHNFVRKRGNPISKVKAQSIRRRYLMMSGNVSWAELGRQFSVNEMTAKKYALKGG
jgi:predicted DNA-binding protein YlxM (UPF0122 family)